MLNRPGTAREVANGIAFLASEEASYLTGTCLFIDGGADSTLSEVVGPSRVRPYEAAAWRDSEDESSRDRA